MSGPAGARRVCSAREATNWYGSWQMELDMGMREWPRDIVYLGGTH